MTRVGTPALRLEPLTIHDGLLEIPVTGEIDYATAPLLRAHLAAARARDHTLDVAVNLEGVPFIDSTGIQSLVQLQRDLASERRALVIVAAKDHVRRVFALTAWTISYRSSTPSRTSRPWPGTNRLNAGRGSARASPGHVSLAANMPPLCRLRPFLEDCQSSYLQVLAPQAACIFLGLRVTRDDGPAWRGSWTPRTAR